MATLQLRLVVDPYSAVHVNFCWYQQCLCLYANYSQSNYRPYWTEACAYSAMSYTFSMIPSCSRKVSNVMFVF